MGTCRTFSEVEKILLGLLDDFVTDKIKESQAIWSGSNQYSSWDRIFFFWKDCKGKSKAHKTWHLFLLRGSRMGGGSWTPSLSTALCSQPPNWAWPGTLSVLSWALPWGSISGSVVPCQPGACTLAAGGSSRHTAQPLSAAAIQRPKSCSGSPTICSTASFLLPLLWKLFLEATLIFFSSIN